MEAQPETSRYDVHSIARYQKGVLICILTCLLLLPAQFELPLEQRPLLAVMAVIPTGIVCVVLAFLLALKVYGTGWGLVLGTLTLIPCLGLITVPIIVYKAFSILKSNGIPVGPLGADSSRTK